MDWSATVRAGYNRIVGPYRALRLRRPAGAGAPRRALANERL